MCFHVEHYTDKARPPWYELLSVSQSCGLDKNWPQIESTSHVLVFTGPLLTSVGFRSLLFALKAAASGLSSPPSSSGDLTSPPLTPSLGFWVVDCECEAGTGLLRVSVSCVDWIKVMLF